MPALFPHSRSRRVFRFAGLAPIAICLVVALALIGLRVSEVRPLAEQTGSMAPTINPGALILVDSIDAGSARKGDVVTFNDPTHHGRTLTHRVVSVKRDGSNLAFVTKGDANKGSERWNIAPTGQIGRAAKVIPGLGAVVRPLGDPRLRGLMMMLLTTLASILALSFVWLRGAPGWARAA